MKNENTLRETLFFLPFFSRFPLPPNSFFHHLLFIFKNILKKKAEICTSFRVFFSFPFRIFLLCLFSKAKRTLGAPFLDAITHPYERLCPPVRPSVHPSVRRSVSPSVHPSVFTLYFFGFLRSLASLLLPKWLGDLKHSPCPPARDWGSRVSQK